MTCKGGTSPACAACKYQRRKCTSDCPLAPYFPPDQPKQFQNAHRLFGVSNILKILKQVNPNQKLVAMQSIVAEANIRDKYPVHGCLGIIYGLRFQIQHTQQELDAVTANLAICRQHHQQMPSPPPPPLSLSSQLHVAAPSAASPTANNALTLFHNHHQQQLNAISSGIAATNSHHPFANADMADSSSNSNANNENNNNNNNDNVNQWWHQYAYPSSYSNNYNNNSPAVQSQFILAQPLTCQQQQATVATHGYDEMSTFLDTIDDRQSYVDSKEAYESRYIAPCCI